MGFDKVEDLLMQFLNEGEHVYEGVMKISKTLDTNKYRTMGDKFERAYEIYKENKNGRKTKKTKSP